MKYFLPRYLILELLIDYSCKDVDECKRSFHSCGKHETCEDNHVTTLLDLSGARKKQVTEDNRSCKRHWIIALLDRSLLHNAETEALETSQSKRKPWNPEYYQTKSNASVWCSWTRCQEKGRCDITGRMQKKKHPVSLL